jgi:peptide chain release factor 2
LRRCGGIFDLEAKRARLSELEVAREAEGFWEDHTAAAQVSQEIAALSGTLGEYETAARAVEDLEALWELMQEEGAAEQEESQAQFDDELRQAVHRLERLEVESLLDGEYDNHAAVVTIHAGAGGVDSCDWAEMLYRMYAMWAPGERLKLTVTDERRGEEAGVMALTFRAAGPHAYGYFKVENGVHRLVRLSPFDNQHRRHTSFASVDAVPELPADFDVQLSDKDIKMDVFRASSAGGQHVNKTSSAVRLTHLPTGFVVTCQNERSQHMNRAVALVQLTSKLVARMKAEHKERIEDLRGALTEIAWGNQIRSYVLQPYQLVKDLRTGHETANAQRVLDGELTPFIWAGLRWLREEREAKPD